MVRMSAVIKIIYVQIKIVRTVNREMYWKVMLVQYKNVLDSY